MITTKDEFCKWTYDSKNDEFKTICGNVFNCAEGNPKEKHIELCPFCNKKIKENGGNEQ